MQRILSIVFAAALVWAAGCGANSPDLKDRDWLQGTWRAVQGEAAGADLPGHFLSVRWTFLASTYKHLRNGKFVLNAKRKPKEIDLNGPTPDQTELGIYEFEGRNRLRICLARPKEDRPTSFSTSPGVNHVLVVLERDTESK